MPTIHKRQNVHDKTCPTKRADVETCRGASLPRGGFSRGGVHTVGYTWWGAHGGFSRGDFHAVGCTRWVARGGLHAVGLYSHIYIMRMCPHDNTCRRYTNDKTCPTKRADVETRRGTSLPRGDLYAVGYTRGFVRGRLHAGICTWRYNIHYYSGS